MKIIEIKYTLEEREFLNLKIVQSEKTKSIKLFDINNLNFFLSYSFEADKFY